MDGNTDDKRVQENFIGTLVETMKGDNFPVYRDVDEEDFDAAAATAAASSSGAATVTAAAASVATAAPDDAASRDPERRRHAAVVGPAVPYQNGDIPNQLRHADAADGDGEQSRRLRHDVRNMYAQIGSYPKDSVLWTRRDENDRLDMMRTNTMSQITHYLHAIGRTDRATISWSRLARPAVVRTVGRRVRDATAPVLWEIARRTSTKRE